MNSGLETQKWESLRSVERKAKGVFVNREGGGPRTVLDALPLSSEGEMNVYRRS